MRINEDLNACGGKARQWLHGARMVTYKGEKNVPSSFLTYVTDNVIGRINIHR